MTSARNLLAAVAFGLAACAHTPPTAIELPDVRRTAPVLMVDAGEVPSGFDEHIVIIIDRHTVEHAYQLARVDHYHGPLYYDPGYAYRRPARRPTPSGDPVDSSSSPMSAPTRPVSRPATPSARSRPGPSGGARDSRR